MADEMLYEITLGALLHDIGKVAQRASPYYKSKRHQEFGIEWLESLPSHVKIFLILRGNLFFVTTLLVKMIQNMKNSIQ